MIQDLAELSAMSLVEPMQNPVMILNSSGRIAFQNAACRKLLGYALRDESRECTRQRCRVQDVVAYSPQGAGLA